MEPWTYKQIRDAISQAPLGTSVCILGPSGVGKTHAVKTLCQQQQYVWDAFWVESGRDFRDIVDKQLSTSLVQNITGSTRKRIMIIDEIETIYNADRNLFTFLASLQGRHDNHVIVYIGNSTLAKRMQAIATKVLFFSAFSEADICLILREKFKSQFCYEKILTAAENCYGNILQAIYMLEMDQATIQTDTPAPEGGFERIFASTGRDDVSKMLQDDPWVNPLRFHENFPKLLKKKDVAVYDKALEVLCNWDMMMQHLDIHDTNLPIEYFTSFVIQNTPKGAISNKIQLGDFTKLFSNLSLQKKNERMAYSRRDQDFPWMQAQIFCDYIKYT
jgi:ABC-type cobalamin/Fe3+-siderophores transport system ATPase subunit